MKTDFIPLRDGDLDSFEENLVNKLAIHATTLGLNPEEVTESITIINEHKSAYRIMNSKKAESKSATENNTNSRDRAIAEIRRLSRQIKSCKTYTSGIGDDLGIIRTGAHSRDQGDWKPVLKANIVGREVVLKFQKDSTDGIRLYSKREGEASFTFLATDTVSPYNDSREKPDPSKPEQREYYAYFFVDDRELGQQSDVLKITIP